MRKVRVYSSAGKTNYEVEVLGTTFSELKTTLKENQIDVEGMKCVIGESKLTLESDNAILPDGDFTLFIMPIKTKSGGMQRAEAYSLVKSSITRDGGMQRAEAYSLVKSFITRDGDKAKNFFNSGKNYTNKSTRELEELINSYNSGNREPVVTEAPKVEALKEKAKTESKNTKIAEVVEKVKTSKVAEVSSDLREAAVNMVKACEAVLGDLEKKKTLKEPLEALRKALGVEPSPIVAEAEAKKQEKDLLAEQAKELMKDFPDVAR